MIPFHLSCSHLSYSLGCRSQSFINHWLCLYVHTLSLWMSWKHPVSFFLTNRTLIYQKPHCNYCQYYSEVFAVHLMRLHLFISLFVLSFPHWCYAESCLSILVYEQKSCWEKCFLMWSDGCDLYSICTSLSNPFFPWSTTNMSWRSLACEVASGYSLALLIFNSQQFQLSLRPHCYWYKAKTLKIHGRSEWESDRWRLDKLTEYFSHLFRAQGLCRLSFQSAPSATSIFMRAIF